MPAKTPRLGKETSERSLNLGEIKDLIDLLIEREISEFEMEKGGLKIRIKRGNSRAEAFAPVGYVEGSLEAAPPASRHAPPPAVPAGAEPHATETGEGIHVIKSPIVGTFYSSPAPNAPPFVRLGDVVEIGQALCIIEAMKLMNEIESEVAGAVVRTYVESGQPVEYGQSLFAIKVSSKR
jgi:acetyl-CoA carboxylase biotin carboxyl carrier protein